METCVDSNVLILPTPFVALAISRRSITVGVEFVAVNSAVPMAPNVTNNAT